MAGTTHLHAHGSLELDYSLTGVNSTLAVEKGMAEADWYQCAGLAWRLRETKAHTGQHKC